MICSSPEWCGFWVDSIVAILTLAAVATAVYSIRQVRLERRAELAREDLRTLYAALKEFVAESRVRELYPELPTHDPLRGVPLDVAERIPLAIRQQLDEVLARARACNRAGSVARERTDEHIIDRLEDLGIQGLGMPMSVPPFELVLDDVATRQFDPLQVYATTWLDDLIEETVRSWREHSGDEPHLVAVQIGRGPGYAGAPLLGPERAGPFVDKLFEFMDRNPTTRQFRHEVREYRAAFARLESAVEAEVRRLASAANRY